MAQRVRYSEEEMPEWVNDLLLPAIERAIREEFDRHLAMYSAKWGIDLDELDPEEPNSPS